MSKNKRTWFAGRQWRRRDKVLNTDVVDKIEIVISRRVEAVHYVSIGAACEVIVIVDQASSIEPNGGASSPIEVTTFVGEDSIRLRGVVCDD